MIVNSPRARLQMIKGSIEGFKPSFPLNPPFENIHEASDNRNRRNLLSNPYTLVVLEIIERNTQLGAECVINEARLGGACMWSNRNSPMVPMVQTKYTLVIGIEVFT